MPCRFDKSTLILTFSFIYLEAQKSHPWVALALALLPTNSRDYYGPFVNVRLVGVIYFVNLCLGVYLVFALLFCLPLGQTSNKYLYQQQVYI